MNPAEVTISTSDVPDIAYIFLAMVVLPAVLIVVLAMVRGYHVLVHFYKGKSDITITDSAGGDSDA